MWVGVAGHHYFGNPVLGDNSLVSFSLHVDGRKIFMELELEFELVSLELVLGYVEVTRLHQTFQWFYQSL